MYKCSGCIYTSTDLTSVRKHINRKNKCTECELNIIKLDTDFNCEFCKKKLSTKDGLKKHIYICKTRFTQNKLKRENVEKDKQIRALEKKLMKNSAKTIINTTNNTMNNQTINNYITISLTPYNDPNMEGMKPYLETALRKTFLSVPNLIESVHFNNEYPENQNICITNRRTNDAKVFDGKKWKTVNKELLLNEIVDTYERELTNYAEENGKTRFIKDYESAKRRGGANAEKDLREEVHNVIYDNSEMVNTKIKEVEKRVVLKSESESESESESIDSQNDSYSTTT